MNGEITKLNEMSYSNATELDIQIATAKNFPRNVKNALLKAKTIISSSEDIAKSCIYALPRKDKNGKETLLKGKSVRLAEVMASCWGNIHAATRIVSNDGKTIKAEAVAWDLENNVKISSEVIVSILTRDGKTYNQDMQVVTGNAACSKALRNAIFDVIPQVFIEDIYNEAVKAAVGESNTQVDFQSRVNKAFDMFSKKGISKEKILSYFGKKIEELDTDDLVSMIGIFNNIKDGNIKAENAFSSVETTIINDDIDELNKQLLGDK
jgi:hypothetical protein